MSLEPPAPTPDPLPDPVPGDPSPPDTGPDPTPLPPDPNPPSISPSVQPGTLSASGAGRTTRRWGSPPASAAVPSQSCRSSLHQGEKKRPRRTGPPVITMLDQGPVDQALIRWFTALVD